MTSAFSILFTLSSLAWGIAHPSVAWADRDCFSALEPRPYTQEAHAAIEHDLFNGEIVEIHAVRKDGNNHGLYVAQLRARDAASGEIRMRKAFFKPRVYGDEDGWSRTPMEYVAYFLNRKLGMDYVPPVAYRKNLGLQVDGQTLSEGAFIFAVPEFQSMHSLPGHRFAENNDAVISDHRVLSVLLQNQDGHSKNLGVGLHWVDGQMSEVFIDFGASLRRGTSVTMTAYPAYENSDPVTRIRKSTYDQLRALRHDSFREVIRAGMMSDGEVWGLLGRRDGIVAYFDFLIRQNGAANVFFP